MSKFRISRDDMDDLLGRLDDGEVADAGTVTKLLSRFPVAGEWDE